MLCPLFCLLQGDGTICISANQLGTKSELHDYSNVKKLRHAAKHRWREIKEM